MSDLISRESVIEIIESVCSADDSYWMPDTLEKIRNLPTHETPSNALGALDCVERRLVSYKLTDLINEFEEILSRIREREENDSVCGLCEYDGAYMGQSGDWCNECPGFDKADCFKLKDKYKKEWLELMNTLPSVQPELSSNSQELENKNGELISRQEAIEAIKEYFKFSPLEGRQCAKAIGRVPSAQSEIIRCKDCRWRDGSECEIFPDARLFPYDFCSRAELRGEQDG